MDPDSPLRTESALPQNLALQEEGVDRKAEAIGSVGSRGCAETGEGWGVRGGANPSGAGCGTAILTRLEPEGFQHHPIHSARLEMSRAHVVSQGSRCEEVGIVGCYPGWLQVNVRVE